MRFILQKPKITHLLLILVKLVLTVNYPCIDFFSKKIQNENKFKFNALGLKTNRFEAVSVEEPDACDIIFFMVGCKLADLGTDRLATKI